MTDSALFTKKIMSITFTPFPNLTWKDKIDLELNAHLESHTGLQAVQSQGGYGFYEIQSCFCAAKTWVTYWSPLEAPEMPMPISLKSGLKIFLR